jgi:cell division septum initiation protein DivIVA
MSDNDSRDTVRVERRDLQLLMKAFDDGIFVRDTTRDHEHDWAVRLLGPARALGAVKLAAESPAVETDVARDLDIAKRATAVERERCLSLVEALYVDFDIDGQTNAQESLVCSSACRALVNVGMSIAGSDAGPHSSEALAWRTRVTGEVAT